MGIRAEKSGARPKRTSTEVKISLKRRASSDSVSKKRKLSTDSAEMRKKCGTTKTNRLGLIGFEEVFQKENGLENSESEDEASINKREKEEMNRKKKIEKLR